MSSSQKHSGALSRRALDLLGRLVRRKHERAGWNGPPAMAAGAIKKRLLARPVSTDEWNKDAPVFLAPRQARRLGVQAPPDYRDARVYVPPSEEGASKLVGENNLGAVSLVDA